MKSVPPYFLSFEKTPVFFAPSLAARSVFPRLSEVPSAIFFARSFELPSIKSVVFPLAPLSFAAIPIFPSLIDCCARVTDSSMLLPESTFLFIKERYWLFNILSVLPVRKSPIFLKKPLSLTFVSIDEEICSNIELLLSAFANIFLSPLFEFEAISFLKKLPVSNLGLMMYSTIFLLSFCPFID